MGQDLASPSTGVEPFYDHLRTSLQGLRASLVELLATVEADPARPQDLARRFGLNKNLTWKISRLVGGEDVFATVPHIPGAAGMRIFLRALGAAGAPPGQLDAVRRAAREFDRVVKLHTGDRASLEIMVSRRMPSAVRMEQDESNRRKAFQANSGIWGVRARTQLALCILAPNREDPELADLVQVNGLDQFHRLRPEARWLLFRRERWDDDGPRPARDAVEEIDPDFPVERGVPLLGRFCSDPIPAIELILGQAEEQYELPPGPVGTTAALTCIFGHIARRVGPAYAAHKGEHSELGCNLLTPVEHLVFDLLVHREYDWAMNPELFLYGRLDGGTLNTTARRERNVLPVADRIHDLGWGLSAVATPRIPFHSKLVRYVFDRVGRDPDDFRTLRLTMSHPPIPTVALLRSALPARRA